MDVKVKVALIAACVTIIGWVAAHLSLKWRENETRRLQIVRDDTAQQIKEFYSPLLVLIEQLDATALVCDKLVPNNPTDKDKIDRLIYEKDFGPVHEEIMQILKTKIHLAENREILQSFSDYMQHNRSGHIRFMLERAKLPALVKDLGFQERFFLDIKDGLNRASTRYDDTVRALQRTSWMWYLNPRAHA